MLLRPTMVGILRCGKMLPPQLNLVIEIEFADAERRGAPGGSHAEHRLRDPERPSSGLTGRPGLCAGRVLQPRLLSGRSLVFSYPTVHTQQSTVPPGVAEHNVTVARAFTKLMGAFVTFWDNDAGSKIYLLPNRGWTWPPSERPGRKTVSWSRRCSWAACSTRTTL